MYFSLPEATGSSLKTELQSESVFASLASSQRSLGFQAHALLEGRSD